MLVALMGLLLTAPLQIAIAVLIKRSSRGPVLYGPKMVGEQFALFPLLRFRTMTLGDGHSAFAAERLTPLGRRLQSSSLDHLPMLVNLLLGHLTLVGPRPMEPAVVDVRDPVWRSYCSVRPGVFNAAVLQLGRQRMPSRRRTWRSDGALVGRWLYALVQSNGNVKMRNPPHADVV